MSFSCLLPFFPNGFFYLFFFIFILLKIVLCFTVKKNKMKRKTFDRRIDHFKLIN